MSLHTDSITMNRNACKTSSFFLTIFCCFLISDNVSFYQPGVSKKGWARFEKIASNMIKLLLWPAWLAADEMCWHGNVFNPRI